MVCFFPLLIRHNEGEAEEVGAAGDASTSPPMAPPPANLRLSGVSPPAELKRRSGGGGFDRHPAAPMVGGKLMWQMVG
uniref:Uncharacterized protein n=1 Tax=Oryza sativa subsp. japonica TaxID=39947 RepID=Q8H5D2_ORYSJ|nr:hypothetical protein [Oryza sativa Japonica Group]BAD31465.1 hypothetical protein [Oryza sativa Japonica Group]